MNYGQKKYTGTSRAKKAFGHAARCLEDELINWIYTPGSSHIAIKHGAVHAKEINDVQNWKSSSKRFKHFKRNNTGTSRGILYLFISMPTWMLDMVQYGAFFGQYVCRHRTHTYWPKKASQWPMWLQFPHTLMQSKWPGAGYSDHQVGP